MRITNDRIRVIQMLMVRPYFWGDIFPADDPLAVKISKKESLPCLLNYLGLRIPVLAGEQKLRGHVQGTLRADIIALGAENALGDIDADTLCFRKKFDGMCRAHPKAERTSDA